MGKGLAAGLHQFLMGRPNLLLLLLAILPLQQKTPWLPYMEYQDPISLRHFILLRIRIRNNNFDPDLNNNSDLYPDSIIVY